MSNAINSLLLPVCVIYYILYMYTIANLYMYMYGCHWYVHVHQCDLRLIVGQATSWQYVSRTCSTFFIASSKTRVPLKSHDRLHSITICTLRVFAIFILVDVLIVIDFHVWVMLSLYIPLMFYSPIQLWLSCC